MEKTLFIHAGGSKTGSSALQNFFEIHASQFGQHGIAYENRVNIKTPYEINSGNGFVLCERVLSANLTTSEIDGLVLSYFGKLGKAICSSEYFAELGVSHWNKLWDSCARLGIRAHVIFYVRNVVPYMQSAYDQMVKRHGEWRAFDQWVVDAGWQHARALMTISENFPLEDVHVMHYDKESVDLQRSFLSVIGMGDEFVIDPGGHDKRVNRSLTVAERETLLAVNQRLGVVACADDSSDDLSTMLISQDPNVVGEPASYNEKTANMLGEKFGADVSWVNSKFFNGRSVVSVLPFDSSSRNGGKSAAKGNNSDYVEKVVMEWAFSKIRSIKEREQGRILTALSRAAQLSVRDRSSELPADFDPVAYLVMNPDVLLAGVDPIVHFISFGRQEERLYKFEKLDVQYSYGEFDQIHTDASREEKALYYCDRNGIGLEIGPSHNPIAPKTKGFNVHILDHLDTDSLRDKYRTHGVNLESIEEVDFVWRGEPLPEVVGAKACYDWIIASHVIEHVPDFISFLRQCEELLKAEGVLSLVIPDKRYCFDHFSPSSSTGSVLDALMERRVRPSPGQIFDHFSNASKMNGKIAWANDEYGAYELVHSFASAQEQWEHAVSTAEYIDVHCWRFTPASFRMMLADLQHLSLVNLEIRSIFDTSGCEFFVTLGKGRGGAMPLDRLSCLHIKKLLDA